MNETKYIFKVLPKRLMVHMPDPKLLGKKSSEREHGQKQYHKKVEQTKKRPVKEKPPLWQRPAVSTPLKYSAAIGVGVALTLGAQRFQQRRASAQP